MKIVILDRDSLGVDTPLEGLNNFGDVTVYDKSSPDEVKDRVSDAEVIIINKVQITKEVIDKAKKAKLICVFATGFDNIDVTYAKERGIAVCNVPAYSTDSVALFTVANVLALFTNLREYNRYVVSGEYSASGRANKLTPVYHEIAGKTWGIIGCGNIGKAVARIAEAMNAKVIVYKRNPLEGYDCRTLDEVCRESDIITIHCPLNSDSLNLINQNNISLMKKNVIIVNEARGAVVNDEDIVNAILEDKIGGFGSDVYTQEPFATDHPFTKIMHLPNVLLTPHAAWGAYESRVRCINIICDNISSFIRGEILNRVDI